MSGPSTEAWTALVVALIATFVAAAIWWVVTPDDSVIQSGEGAYLVLAAE